MRDFQGRDFESPVLREVCQRLGVQKTRTTPLHPHSDELVERLNRTLATQLAIPTSQHQRDICPPVLWSYRSAAQESSHSACYAHAWPGDQDAGGFGFWFSP